MNDKPQEPDESTESADAQAGAELEKLGKKAKKSKKPKKSKEPRAPKDPTAKKKGFPIVFALVPAALIAALVLAFLLPPTHALLAKTPLGPLMARLGHSSPTKGVAAGPRKPPLAAGAATTVGAATPPDAAATRAPAAGPQSSGAPAGDGTPLDARPPVGKPAAGQGDARIAQLQAEIKQLSGTPGKSAGGAVAGRAAAGRAKASTPATGNSPPNRSSNRAADGVKPATEAVAGGAGIADKPAPDAPAAAPAPKPTSTAVSDDVKRAAEYWAGMDADKAADIIKELPDAYVKQVLTQMPADAVAEIMSVLPPKTAARLTIDARSTVRGDTP